MKFGQESRNRLVVLFQTEWNLENGSLKALASSGPKNDYSTPGVGNTGQKWGEENAVLGELELRPWDGDLRSI